MKGQEDSTFNTAGSNHKRMKVCTVVRTILPDSDFDDSEDSYARTADACFATWHNQEESSIGSYNSTACFLIL